MIRRYGNWGKPGITYRRRPGVYAILPRADEMLLTYQGGIHQEIQLPGGGVDPGESQIRALHREVFEETGWSIASPRRLGTFRRLVYMPEYDMHAEKICTIYVAHPVRKLGPAPEPDHLPIWAPLSEAADQVAVSGDAAFIRHYIQRLTR